MSDQPKRRVDSAAAWAEARALLYQHRARLLVGLVVMLVNLGAGFVLPWLSGVLIDEVVAKRRVELLPTLAFAAAGATAVQALTSFALSQLLGVAAQRAITEMRRRVQDHVTRLPVRFFDSTQTGVLISRIMTDAEGIRNLVGTGLVQLTSSTITAIAALAVLLYLDWRMTLVNLLILSVFGAVMVVAFKRLRPQFRERGRLSADLSGRLGESLGGIRIVKAYTAEHRERLIFTRGAYRLFRNIAGTMTGISAVTAISTMIVGIVGVIMITMGGHSMLEGTMTIGDFFKYLAFTAMLAAPVVQLASIGTQVSEAFAGLDRIREIRNAATEEASSGDLPVQTLRGDVAFHDVTFAYEPGVPVLKRVSFRAPAGSTTALVGSSGSGKSTLIGIVMAFHRPGSGRVEMDGRDLTSLKLLDYRSHLGVVLQDNFLFDGTIADNIAFSRPTATRAEIERVAAIAHCDEFVSRFEKSYDTIVGERGVKLSGGQRQRVAIARAILADPSILILDEATSSLDSESEMMIQDGLQALRRGRTTFVIAHRLSTIRSADQILVLESGEIVERGAHAELMALNGRYRELHDRQYQLEYDRFVNPGEDFTPEPISVRASSGDTEDQRPPRL